MNRIYIYVYIQIVLTNENEQINIRLCTYILIINIKKKNEDETRDGKGDKLSNKYKYNMASKIGGNWHDEGVGGLCRRELDGKEQNRERTGEEW